MQFVLLSPEQVQERWPAIAELVWPAARQDSHYTLETLRKRLLNGLDHLFEISGEAQGYMALQLSNDLACWVKCAAGRVDGGPRQRVQTIRKIMTHIESVARDAGCSEIKICGRDWSRVLTDYEPFDGFRNGIRKRL